MQIGIYSVGSQNFSQCFNKQMYKKKIQSLKCCRLKCRCFSRWCVRKWWCVRKSYAQAHYSKAFLVQFVLCQAINLFKLIESQTWCINVTERVELRVKDDSTVNCKVLFNWPHNILTNIKEWYQTSCTLLAIGLSS